MAPYPRSASIWLRRFFILCCVLAFHCAAGNLGSAKAATVGGALAAPISPGLKPLSLDGAKPSPTEGAELPATGADGTTPLPADSVNAPAPTPAASPADPLLKTSDSTTATAAGDEFAPGSAPLTATVAPATLPQTGGGAPTAAPQEGDSTVFIPAGSVWKYLDNGSDQGTAWHQLLFDDSTWASGPAQLGYGDGDEATVLGFGPDAANKYPTTYFRRSFDVKNAAAYKTLALRLLRDDGAVVYLNGKEVFRSNMPAGAINYKTYAAGGIADAAEKIYQDKKLDPSLLVDGTNVITVEVHQDGPASSDISFDAELVGSTVVPLIPSGAVWKYLDNGSDQGTAWRTTSFDDSMWASGAAQLGYGDGDEATVVGYGPDPANKYVTTYFRRSFSVADPSVYKGLKLRLLRDDGAVVYLNGKEVFRSNMPAGAVTSSTAAYYSNGENVYQEKTVDPSLLVGGTNVIAVEVHQETANSSDMSFDLELAPYNPSALIPAGSVWKYLDNGSDQGTAWRATSFNDGLWASGTAQLGYGDGDEATVVGFGADPANKYITTYFRRSFSVGDPAAFKQLKLRLLRDDGAVVYLNGKEVFRSNMPTGAVNYKTAASANPVNENVYEVATIDPGFLVKGANVMAVEIHQDGPASSDISFDAELIASKETLVDGEGAWKYQANGADLGNAWRAPTFDDSGWPVGNAELGYGDGDEATVVGYGPDPANKYVTTYFRRSFSVADASLYKALALRLLRDDGAIVYLNGQEVLRSNMPAGAVNYKTFAADQVLAPEESLYVEKAIDPALLVNGTNVLAVEIHQDSLASSDISFALELISANSPPRVNITAPVDGSTAAGPVNITVSADASDDDGSISKVDFYANSKLVGTSDAAPYRITWGNVAAGSYALTAVATDDAGAKTISRVVNVTVNQGAVSPGRPPLPASCKTADVVALDQVYYYNRLGAVNPAGMMYALRRDIVPVDAGKGIAPGNVQLRADKRPRPLVLRMNVGDCLTVNFQNLLAPSTADDNQPATRTAGVHVIGMQPVNSILDDGSNVGTNPSSLVGPGGTAAYTFYAEREGNHLLYSTAATTGGEGDGGSLAMGLFGSLNVEPKGAEWYRSQVTAADLQLATVGKTADGHPIINYNAVYPAGHPYAGLPILNILQGDRIVHSDLNAIITGPNHGRFPAGTYRANATEPDRDQPFREFTVIYHDEVEAVQAFPKFYDDPVLGHTLHSVRDKFAINYGIGGIGSEILANRLGVGPMASCAECKYEEFFLTSWSVGDPAEVVDVPANAKDTAGNLIAGAKATKVFYPDDPSNVHHSYIGDHVKMRVVHAGPKEHHIHHLHAHQWLRTPDDDNSSYLDSQAVGPGYSFTTEIAHGGSGNRNQTVGDSIFHCHFYPHFAQGMWELWRSHDVFESGTALDADGRPAPGSRALPDGEISAGTPIPALVPVPTIAMAPMPEAQVSIVKGQAQVTGAGNPGYPFFVAGVAGHRPPHPPLDTVDDGGLPRHVITGGTTAHAETRLDFSKELLTAFAEARPETGTPTEVAAMNYHAQRIHPSFTPDGTAASYILNGLPAAAGAPFADPCVDDKGVATGTPRSYKAALIQTDIKLNKAGWHFPQSRILTLWGDVAATQSGQRPPEPFFFRANTNDCITFYHTVLAPNVYQQDDFQVKTPTDIMGQHIHLVKFDVTASDGAGNGWNYEDGTFSPEEVIERINAINKTGGMKSFGTAVQTTLAAKPHPYFGTLGAQTTVQRWYADNTLNNNGVDRTLRTVFTHDHFGPSTHQQAGLYAGLVVEPQDSTWRHSETGQTFGGRFDGGPTSWRADILPQDQSKSYREFLLEFADYQLAYQAGGGVDAAGKPVADPQRAINPPVKNEVGLPFIVEAAKVCPGGVPAPCPEAVSSADPGTMSVNYRNEPLALRVRDPQTNTQTAGEPGDLSHAYRSLTNRADPLFNVQPNFYPALTGGVKPGDPFTPLLRAYEDDRVQIRVLVGAHEEGHNFGVNGVRWLFEPGTPEDPASVNNSGYRSNQMMGISEHYEFVIPKMAKNSIGAADYLYQPGQSVDDQWNGLWGIMRAYNSTQPDLQPLPNNPNGHGPAVSNPGDFNGVCPKTAPVRNFDVTAVSAQAALPGGTLVYNSRTNAGGQLHDPTAIMFVRATDLDATGKLAAGVPVEPLVLRANAGDCINVTLTNTLPGGPPDLDGFNTLPMIVEHFNANQLAPSGEVGLHPQLLHFDVTRSNGQNVGFNPVQTAKSGLKTTYQWYAGEVTIDSVTGVGTARPVEFGATNLSSSDPVKHSNKGAIGALIIEPQGSAWIEDAKSRAQATVTDSNGRSFREFVLAFQNDVNLRVGAGNGTAVPNLAGEEDSEDSGQKAFNYRTEPLWKRMGYNPDAPLETTRTFDYTDVLSNSAVGGDPVTPVFTAKVGQPVRFRILMPGGHARNNVFNLYGHIWEEEPYANGSTVIGPNPLSEWKGAQYGVGPGSHFDLLLKHGAGGNFLIPGDYLYRSQQSFQFDGGLWGIFRVTP